MRAVLIAVALAGLTLSACQETANRQPARHNIPLPPQLMALMSEKGMHQQSPILIRSFKKESELEVWKMGRSGRYEHLKTYPICRWSGQLGPKKREGDRMAPEGFYTITPAQMNPNSSFYLSFNMGYPNAFDRAHGRTGAHLMVHGACSSMGCYSMSDDQMAEIYALVREAHNGGQRGVQMQALPFRMSPENLARFRYDPNMPFWRNLKEGADISRSPRSSRAPPSARRGTPSTAQRTAARTPAPPSFSPPPPRSAAATRRRSPSWWPRERPPSAWSTRMAASTAPSRRS